MCYRVAALTQSGQAGGLSLGRDRSDPHHCPRGFNAARPALTFQTSPRPDRDAETFKAVGDAIALVKNKV